MYPFDKEAEKKKELSNENGLQNDLSNRIRKENLIKIRRLTNRYNLYLHV